jgi:hypothetical protein
MFQQDSAFPWTINPKNVFKSLQERQFSVFFPIRPQGKARIILFCCKENI